MVLCTNTLSEKLYCLTNILLTTDVYRARLLILVKYFSRHLKEKYWKGKGNVFSVMKIPENTHFRSKINIIGYFLNTYLYKIIKKQNSEHAEHARFFT